ncbi:hypothetical protein CSUI_005528 [Cystoisospora suis]|uniref:Sel1 repeat-containing protein n=1 Tax=Cystoisospora suis TaxID=483139 RepID=A0A2C6KWS6_9APIC|nr:hypothetical protein CSUI_005528 [Cystoisospora suis]
MCNLSRLLMKGLGVKEDAARAFNLLREAASRGHLQAKLALESHGRILPRPLLEVALGYADPTDAPPAPIFRRRTPDPDPCDTPPIKGDLTQVPKGRSSVPPPQSSPASSETSSSVSSKATDDSSLSDLPRQATMPDAVTARRQPAKSSASSPAVDYCTSYASSSGCSDVAGVWGAGHGNGQKLGSLAIHPCSRLLSPLSPGQVTAYSPASFPYGHASLQR